MRSYATLILIPKKFQLERIRSTKSAFALGIQTVPGTGQEEIPEPFFYTLGQEEGESEVHLHIWRFLERGPRTTNPLGVGGWGERYI